MAYSQKLRRLAIVLVLVAGSLSFRSAQAQTLTADYQFQQVYTSTGGTLGALTPINPAEVSFVTDTVNGNSQYVLQTSSYTGTTPNEVGGVQTPANPFADGGAYSIVLEASFQINAANLAATKVFDFADLTSDAGLYLNAATGSLEFIHVVNGVSVPEVGGTGVNTLVSGTYYQITLTRTAAGVVTASVNGTQDFQFTDTDGSAIVDNKLTLFTDDGTGIGGSVISEGTVGDIAELQLFNPAGGVPEPSTWVLLAGGGVVCALVALRRRNLRAA